MTLDIAGRRVLEAPDQMVDAYDVNDAVVQEVHYGKHAGCNGEGASFTEEDFGALVNPSISVEPPQVSHGVGDCYSGSIELDYLGL